MLCALLDAWKEDLSYRVSRVKARIKFMVDDLGPEGMRAEVERRLGYSLPDFELDAPPPMTDHIGVQPEKEDGVVSIGVPVKVGLLSGDQMVAVAELATELGRRRARDAPAELRRSRPSLPPTSNASASGSPSSSFRSPAIRSAPRRSPAPASRTATSPSPRPSRRLDVLIEHLEARFGDALAGLQLHLDGCPHACAHHWVGDLGFQGSTVRNEEGVRRQAYDLLLRGGLGPDAAIARPVFRRVPTEELDDTVTGLLDGWLQQREIDESFRAFCDRMSDEQLGVLAGQEPAKSRKEKEEVAA